MRKETFKNYQEITKHMMLENKEYNAHSEFVENQDVLADWNQYIFNLNTSKDLKARIIQGSAWVYEVFTSCAITYLEDVELLTQDENGKWSWTKND